MAFGSSAHGAGRAPRPAKKTDAASSDGWKNRHTRSRLDTQRAFEEAPDAYKDVDDVIRLTAEANLARPVARMNPLAVIKG